MAGAVENLMAMIDQARGGHESAKGMLAEARGVMQPDNIPVEKPEVENPLDMLSDYGHIALDVAGFIPGVGIAADLLNAGLYAVEGDFASAGLSAVSAVPIVGDAAAAVKLGAKGVDALSAVDTVDEIVDTSDESS